MGWKQLQYTTQEELAAALSDLVTVTSLDPDGQLEVVGTAFPIMALKSHTVLLSARHVIEQAFQWSKSAYHPSKTSDMGHLPGSDNSLYLRIDKWVQESSDLKCQLVVGQNSFECEVLGVCLRPPLDIALLVVDSTPLGNEAMPVFSINSDSLQIGDEVVVTSFVTKNNKPRFERTLIGRYGQITAIDSTGPLAEAPVYTTNIPIEAGASGGPAFLYTGNFLGPKQVIGVISADFSRPKAFSDEEIDGCSRISMICSAAPLQIQDKESGVLNFKELCGTQRIKDHGTAMKVATVEYNSDGSWHQKIPLSRL